MGEHCGKNISDISKAIRKIVMEVGIKIGMKKSIVFRISGNKQWIGGVYYYKNVIFSTLCNPEIIRIYDIVICVTQSNYSTFKEFEDKAKIKILPENKILFDMMIFLKMMNPLNKYVYCLNSTRYDRVIGKKSIYWIPDFQYLYYPEYFMPHEIIDRNEKYSKISYGKGSLVLSSHSCKKDFSDKYPDYTVKTVVVPFVSDISNIIMNLKNDYEKDVLEKYKLQSNNYIYIPNQFWQHKNHIIVLEAIKKLAIDFPEFQYKFVFTGELNDYRNKNYFRSLGKLMEDSKIENNIVNLGFIPRTEQIVVMKNAKFLIQPSLFEGWGTVLEDAKVLDKRILLSDIPVHHEQKNQKCTLFSPYNSAELANLIIKCANEEFRDDLQYGVNDMKERALIYSKGLETLFDIQHSKELGEGK